MNCHQFFSSFLAMLAVSVPSSDKHVCLCDV